MIETERSAEPAADKSVASRPRGVTWRSVTIAFLLVPLNAYWVAMTETVWYAGFPTTISLFYNVVFILVALTLLNALVRLRWPRHALHHGELMVVYTILCLTSTMVSHDMLQVLTPIMTYCYNYAKPENEWGELFLRYVPRWLTVDGSIPAWLGGGSSDLPTRLMYEGGSSLYIPAIWKAWVVPVGMWTIFCTMLYGMTLGLNVIFRRRWIESERLTFPIVQLPFELSKPRTTLTRSRMFWIVLAVVFAADILNGLNVYNAKWPRIPLTSGSAPGYNIGAQIPDWPWNVLSHGGFMLGFYPFAVGLCLLLPTELAFSCWTFFFIFKVMRVLCAVWGIYRGEGPPYIEEQSFSAYMALAVFSGWTARHHLVGVWRAVWGLPGRLDDAREPMSYRMAGALVVIGFSVAVIFGWRAGMGLTYAFFFFLIYLLLSQAVSRIRAEMGLPAHDLHHAGPGVMLERIIGTVNIPPPTRTATEVFCWFNRAYRAHPAPHQIEGFKLAERTRFGAKPLAWAMALSIPIGAITAYWVLLHCMYDRGVAAHFMEPKVPLIFGQEPWIRLAGAMQNPQPYRATPAFAIGIGFVVTLVLMSLQVRIPWWPLHPAGYAVSSSWAMMYLWCPMLIAWVAKSLVTRYGGNRAFHSLVPVAFGLILGDMAGGCFWSMWALWRLPATAPYCIWGK